MDFNAIFPLSARVGRQDSNSLIWAIILYLAACAIVKVADILLGWVPIVGIVIGVLCWVLGLYCAIGIILAIVNYCKKD